MHEATFVDNGYIYCLDCGDGFIVCVCVYICIYMCVCAYIFFWFWGGGLMTDIEHAFLSDSSRIVSFGGKQSFENFCLFHTIFQNADKWISFKMTVFIAL